MYLFMINVVHSPTYASDHLDPLSSPLSFAVKDRRKAQLAGDLSSYYGTILPPPIYHSPSVHHTFK